MKSTLHVSKNETRERSAIIADIICEEIVAGRFKPGKKLNEATIASHFKVSRGPVREALRRLSERELVVFSPNAGARVVCSTLVDMLHLMEVRESLEVSAAKLAAERMTLEEKQKLSSLYQAHSVAFSTDKQHAYLQSPEDLDFHYVIAKGAGNPILFKILCEDLYPKLRLCRSQHQYIKGRGEQALIEHQHILQAIESNDPELAEIYMRRHLRSARESLRTSIGNIAIEQKIET